MKKVLFLSLFLMLTLSQGRAQNDVLFQIDNDPVYASEFERVYKKNLDLVQDDEQKDINTYLKLFIDYKLKVKEAETLGLDTIVKFKRELETYRNQLAKNYLTDSNVTEALVKEAYNRSLKEINASHILIKVDENAAPTDTLKAFQKIIEIREQALSGKNFGSLAKQYSNDPSAQKNEGNLGWFSALRMVYPFENTAYNTEIDSISKPFRTQFGYHIVKVNDIRTNRGQVEVAHIMVAEKPNDPNFNAEARINELYQKVQQGEDFGVLAKQFSDDRNSAQQAGKLNIFGSGDLLSKTFEDQAFNLKKQGEVSKPFKTQFGWHIVKLIKAYPVDSYDKVRAELERLVTKDSRANNISKALFKDLRQRYSIGDQDKALQFFNTYITDAVYQKNWKLEESARLKDTLITIRDSIVTYRDFANHVFTNQGNNRLKGRKDVMIDRWMADFINQKLIQYHKTHLEEEEEEFAYIVKEYRDGLLLFDLMEKNIWQAAKNDSVGLKEFYNANKEDYAIEQQLKVNIAKVSNKKDAKKARKLMKKGLSQVEIKSLLNSNNSTSTLFQNGTYEINSEALPSGVKSKLGVSQVLKDDEYYTVVNVLEIIEAGARPLNSIKGIVISDYQKFLETQWIKGLRDKYTVEINEAVLKQIKSKLEVQNN